MNVAEMRRASCSLVRRQIPSCVAKRTNSFQVFFLRLPTLKQSRQRGFHCIPVVFLATARTKASLVPQSAATIRLVPSLYQAVLWPSVRRCLGLCTHSDFSFGLQSSDFLSTSPHPSQTNEADGQESKARRFWHRCGNRVSDLSVPSSGWMKSIPRQKSIALGQWV